MFKTLLQKLKRQPKELNQPKEPKGIKIIEINDYRSEKEGSFYKHIASVVVNREINEEEDSHIFRTISAECGYNTAGYGLYGTCIAVQTAINTYTIQWMTSDSCD